MTLIIVEITNYTKSLLESTTSTRDDTLNFQMFISSRFQFKSLLDKSVEKLLVLWTFTA